MHATTGKKTENMMMIMHVECIRLVSIFIEFSRKNSQQEITTYTFGFSNLNETRFSLGKVLENLQLQNTRVGHVADSRRIGSSSVHLGSSPRCRSLIASLS